jgi:Protein of unknown function with HXXEE motif
MCWIPALALLAHVVEEYPRFPEWATRHFGTTSRPWYVYSHIPLIAAVLGISFLAATAPAATLFPLLATAVQCALATNAVFHVATTFIFREYSPGVVTAVLIFVPGTAYLVDRTVREGLLTLPQVAVAVAIGTVVGIAVIASLWLPMDIDWRFRRSSPSGLTLAPLTRERSKMPLR